MGIAEAYDPDTRWGRAFGVVDRENYSPPLYQHRGQDIRKLAPGGGYSVAADVLSLSAGVVSHQFTAMATGREVVVDTGRNVGRYEIHCHSAYFPGVGSRLDVGSTITRNATSGESPGTGWDAPHDHLVISDYPDAAHTPSRPVYDPRPFILSALAGAVGGGARPFEPEEEPDMDANDKALAAQMATDVSVIKQLLTETQQWKGIGAIVSETLQTVGVIKQLLTETEQWKGIGFLVSETYQTVTQLAAAISAIAEHDDAGGVDPAIIAELRASVDRLAAVNFPTEATITDAVTAAAQKARIDELEAELSRLRETAGTTA